MSSHFPGGRFHGAHQDSEMDVAWQELMAITEMQVSSSILALGIHTSHRSFLPTSAKKIRSLDGAKVRLGMNRCISLGLIAMVVLK